jgi:hypothetical protein
LKQKYSCSVFSRKFVFSFREKSLREFTKITKVFAKTFVKTKIFAKNDTGSENAVKHPNSKRQTKFTCRRNAVDQRIRVMLRKTMYFRKKNLPLTLKRKLPRYFSFPRNNLTKTFAKINFFAKTLAKTKIFAKTKSLRENFHENETFSETKFRKISRKLAHFRLIFAFPENETSFRFNPRNATTTGFRLWIYLFCYELANNTSTNILIDQ